MDMVGDEKRSYVRGDLFFKVKFRTLTPDEYKTLLGIGEQILSPYTQLGKGNTGPSKKDNTAAPNDMMLDLFLQTDEKLDQVLALLSKGKDHDGLPNQGVGVNISGSGMNVIVHKPLETGKIIHTNFVLSRFPTVYIRVFGEIVRVSPVNDENGRAIYNLGTKFLGLSLATQDDKDVQKLYKLGIRFLDLNPDDRERIIACVFQRQREVLRKRKGQRDFVKDR